MLPGENSVPAATGTRPEKPYPEFPVFADKIGEWFKKTRESRSSSESGTIQRQRRGSISANPTKFKPAGIFARVGICGCRLTSYPSPISASCSSSANRHASMPERSADGNSRLASDPTHQWVSQRGRSARCGIADLRNRPGQVPRPLGGGGVERGGDESRCV